eukprot:755435-Hanusia_phi.AAC.1
MEERGARRTQEDDKARWTRTRKRKKEKEDTMYEGEGGEEEREFHLSHHQLKSSRIGEIPNSPSVPLEVPAARQGEGE